VMENIFYQVTYAGKITSVTVIGVIRSYEDDLNFLECISLIEIHVKE
jgi:hypothetical protein